jgi:hypothetical protein
MISNIFAKKLNIVDSFGNTVLDLWQQSIQWITDKITIDSTVLVTKDFTMRPDLIAQAAWGDAGSADLLMKFNHISNPFSIDQGMIMVIPNYEVMAQQIFTPDSSTDSQAIVNPPTPTTIQFKNVAKQQYNARNTAQSNTPISANSPNQAEPGDQQIRFVGGQILFGASVGTSATTNSADIPLQKAALIAKITANTLTQTS